ncbi:hypothetical protein EVAR_12994_1 [Eumeta japonica]|uniref:Uncharacterized protein n=1 Tax=Eumeta variegata TaxID=151549 RepID=A0A4C1TWV0_EUMVA|nr:hypothetical protein EVAR_12994_1 [Eumeta japonica]
MTSFITPTLTVKSAGSMKLPNSWTRARTAVKGRLDPLTTWQLKCNRMPPQLCYVLRDVQHDVHVQAMSVTSNRRRTFVAWQIGERRVRQRPAAFRYRVLCALR